MEIKRTGKLYTVKRIILIVLASFFFALNINSFIHIGDIIPGGFMGVTLLAQQVGAALFNINIPFSPLYYGLCAIPAIVSYFYIGKKFTIYSCVAIFLLGFFTDYVPPIFINYLDVQNPLLSAVFGGLLNAFSISLCLHAGATSGGTDFIAIFISERLRKDGWRFVFFFNCVILLITAYLFNIDKVLYSIIFQYITTIGINYFYLGYQQKTLLIITDSPTAVYEAIKISSNHAATSFSGIGQFLKKEKTLIYSVVSADEVNSVIVEIKKCDPKAFVNVIRSDHINGNFHYREHD
ncbi:MAG: YitT family protein [Chitinivibrionia bacterium]|nr:YitT family protein [Chitinivibrionia bacterium]